MVYTHEGEAEGKISGELLARVSPFETLVQVGSKSRGNIWT